MTEFRTGIGTSDADTISLLGHDLAEELLGEIGFAELAYWLIVGRRPSSGQLSLFEAVLVSLADHGFTPTAIAARMTYYSAPDSFQGALAAGLLGGGSRFLGVTENALAFTERALEEHGRGRERTSAQWDELAREVLAAARADGAIIPGLGHPVHKVTDPRTAKLISLAHFHKVAGEHLALFEAIGRVHPDVLGKTLPLNGAGVAGVILGDIGVPVVVARGVPLLARTAGLVGHLAEEAVAPVAPEIYRMVDRNARYVDVRDDRDEAP